MVDYDALQEWVVAEGVEFIDCRVVDFVGRWRHLTIPVRRLTETLVEQGVAFDGSNYGYVEVSGSDMVLRPDLDTAAVVTYQGHKILSLLGEIYRAGGREPFLGDPRGIARRAECHLVREGIAEEVMLSPEFEFYVFADVRYQTTNQESSYVVSPLTEQEGYSFYHICPPDDQLFALRNKICQRLEERGVPVKYHHHEVGSFGQVEIELGFTGLLRMADITLMVKHIARETACEEGLTATFMPKPLFAEAGSGLHVHQYLARGGRSLFEDKGRLSDLALCYIGGILTHGASLMALTNPSTNSYRRLVPGYEAPISLTFGVGNRSAAIRIPEYATPEERRIELRTLDATCNPYLAYTAMVMAGLDGIQHNWNAERLGFGPYQQNLYSLSGEEQSKITQMPVDLEGALCALEEDHDYLLAGSVFDEAYLAHWITVKREEISQVRRRPHPYEFLLYYTL